VGLFSLIILKRKTFIEDMRSKAKKLLGYRGTLFCLLKENKLVIGLLGAFVFMMYLISLAPVSKTDELYYYIYFIKRIVAQGGIVFDFFPVVTFQPMGQQLWYLPVYGLGATEAPAILNLFTSLLIFLFTYLWLSKYMDRKLVLLAVLVTYLNPNGIAVYPAPQDNVAHWLWGLLALIITFEFLYSEHRKDHSNSTLILLGMIFVSACISKIVNIPIVGLCIIAVVYSMVRNKYCMKALFLLLVPFIVFYAPFLIRIYLWTGNPFFPSLLNVFGSSAFDPEAVKAYFGKGTAIWAINIKSILWYTQKCLLSDLRLGNLGPVLIFLTPVAAIYLWSRKKYLIMIVACGSLITIFFSRASDRLLVGVTIFFVLTLFLYGRNIVSTGYAAKILKLYALFIVCITAIYFIPFGRYIFGFETKEEFLKTKVQTYAGIQWANKNIQKGSVVLTNIREKYYFDFPVYSGEEIPLFLGRDVRKVQTVKELYNIIKKNKITHLFWVDKEPGKYSKRFYALISEIITSNGKLIYNEDGVTLVGVRHPFRKPEIGNLKIYELF